MNTRKPHETPAKGQDWSANRFRAEHHVDGKELHLYALGPISDNLWYGDEVTPQMVLDALKDKGAADTLHLHVNSYGGSVFAGIAIHNMISKCGLKTIATVEGIAASAASVILMACDERRVPANAFVMIHNPWTIAAGEANDLRKTADTLDQIANALVHTYASRSALSEDEVRVMLDAETWLNGEDAALNGIATHTDPAVEIAAAVRPILGRGPVNLPAALSAAIEEDKEEEEKETPAEEEDEDEEEKEEAKAEEDEEEDEAKTEEEKEEEETPAEEDDEDEEEEEMAKANAEIARLNAALALERTARITAEVDCAIAHRRIRADRRDEAIATCSASADSAAALASFPRTHRHTAQAAAVQAKIEADPITRLTAIFKSQAVARLN